MTQHDCQVHTVVEGAFIKTTATHQKTDRLVNHLRPGSHVVRLKMNLCHLFGFSPVVMCFRQLHTDLSVSDLQTHLTDGNKSPFLKKRITYRILMGKQKKNQHLDKNMEAAHYFCERFGLYFSFNSSTTTGTFQTRSPTDTGEKPKGSPQLEPHQKKGG